MNHLCPMKGAGAASSCRGSVLISSFYAPTRGSISRRLEGSRHLSRAASINSLLGRAERPEDFERLVIGQAHHLGQRKSARCDREKEVLGQ